MNQSVKLTLEKCKVQVSKSQYANDRTGLPSLLRFLAFFFYFTCFAEAAMVVRNIKEDIRGERIGLVGNQLSSGPLIQYKAETGS